MIAQVGDAPVVVYRLYNPDVSPMVPVDATVAVTVTSPSGTVTAPAVAHPSLGVYQAEVPLTVAGEWTVTWSATGPVTDSETVRLYAVDPAGGAETLQSPPWAPQLEDVAVHIPSRTRHATTNLPLGTFTQDTTPTDDQAARLIGHATAWVIARTGTTVAAAAYAQCMLAASLWAAYWVELGYPERDGDVTVYERVRVDAEAATVAAVALNTAAGGGTSIDPPDDGTAGTAALPSYSFPAAPAWADATPGTYW